MAIIESLIDTDLYKLTMMQAIYHKYTSIHVKYKFKWRNWNKMYVNEPLMDIVDHINEEIEKCVKRDQKRNKKGENIETTIKINQKKSEYTIIYDYPGNCQDKLNELSENYYIEIISMCSMNRVYLSILVSIKPKK